MYKLVFHRYGKANIYEYDTLEEALSFKEYAEDEGEGFVEYVLDTEDRIMEHGFEHVIGVKLEESPIGKKYDVEKMKIA